MTRRGRRVVGVFSALMAAIAVLAVLGLGSPQASASDGSEITTRTVGTGESLWSVASDIAGDGDVSAVVYEIRQLNNLSGSTLSPGQVLVVPTR